MCSSACARLVCATLPLEWALSVCPRQPRCYRRPVGGDISTWVHLPRSNWGERVGPGGSELWAGAKVISTEARRGGEKGLGDKDPDGEAGRCWSPASWDQGANFYFFERLLCPTPFPLCPRGVFLYRGALSSPLAYPRALPAPSDRTRLEIWAPGVPQVSSPKLRFPRPAPQGRRTHLPNFPVLDPSETPPPTAIRLFRTPGPGPCASGHCTARAEGGKPTRALCEMGPGVNKLSLSRRWAPSKDFRARVCNKKNGSTFPGKVLSLFGPGQWAGVSTRRSGRRAGR